MQPLLAVAVAVALALQLDPAAAFGFTPLKYNAAVATPTVRGASSARRLRHASFPCMERGRFVCGPLSAETQPQGEEGSSPAPVLEVMEGLEEEGEGVAAKPKEPRGFVELSEEELEKMSKEERFKYDKALEAARLRAAETFIIKETGDFECNACSFVYRKKDSDLGTSFDNLPGTWRCPICGAAKETFRAQTVTIAGFEVNQGYGFGTNTMTEGQKNLLIFGSLGIFFLLFIGGYALE